MQVELSRHMTGRSQRELHSIAKEAEFMASVVSCTQMKYAVCETVSSLSLHQFKQSLEDFLSGFYRSIFCTEGGFT